MSSAVDPQWRGVPVDAALADLIGRSFLVADDDRFGDAAAVSVEEAPLSAMATVTLAFLDGEEPARSVSAPRSQSLGEAVRAALDLTPTRAMEVPGIRWSAPARRLPGPMSAVALVAPVATIAFVLALSAGPRFAAVAGAVLSILVAVLWLVGRSSSRQRTEVLGPELKHVLPTSEALALLGSQHSAAIPAPDHPERPEPDPAPASARARIDDLKAAYGALLSDVVYRIENSSLFDNAVPLTRDFNLLLMRWDEESRDLPAVELSALARQVELAFETARRHAETVGLGHLPQTARADGARAAKAARLARRSPSEGERRAALAQASRLLSSLALYYLPAPDEVPKMLGGGPRQLSPSPE